MKNILTADVESYHGVKIFLDLLDKYEQKATFFMLGELITKNHETAKSIAERGHEIGCHGFSHIKIYKLGKMRFIEEIKRSIHEIWKATRISPAGFRAPWFSVNEKTGWALNALEKLGFRYDSSIFPARIPWYGVRKAPTYPYRPSREDPTREDETRDFMELPLLVRSFGSLRIPAAGGIYLGLFGIKFIKSSILAMNKKGYPAVLYAHPWSFSPTLTNLPIYSKILAHGTSYIKLFEKLIRRFSFRSAIEIIEDLGLLI